MLRLSLKEKPEFDHLIELNKIQGSRSKKRLNESHTQEMKINRIELKNEYAFT